MQTAIDTELIIFNEWTIRVRPTPNPNRLLLLIHGFTGDENSMWVFAQNLPSRYWIIAPRAPYPVEPSGFSWRPHPFTDLGMPSLEQLQPMAEALIHFIDAYALSAGLEADTIDVLGFSQGGVMSSVLAFLFPHRIRKIGILAGFVPKGLETITPERPLEGKRVFVAHGTRDKTVTVKRARDSIGILEQAGAQVIYCEDEVGHKVSVKCLQALKDYFSD